MSTFQDIKYNQAKGIARITISRPAALNAFRGQTLDELIQAMIRADGDETVRVIVLEGDGDKAFSSGMDLHAALDHSAVTEQHWMVTRNLNLSLLMRNISKPIIAAIRGWAAVGGFELMLFCDLRIAADNAKFRATTPGLAPLWGTTQLLPIIVGEARAREIILLSRDLNAFEAERIGLINKVVPLSQIEQEVGAWCDRICESAPAAIRMSKLSLNALHDTLYPALLRDASIVSNYYGTPQNQEYFRSHLEKRTPHY